MSNKTPSYGSPNSCWNNWSFALQRQIPQLLCLHCAGLAQCTCPKNSEYYGTVFGVIPAHMIPHILAQHVLLMAQADICQRKACFMLQMRTSKGDEKCLASEKRQWTMCNEQCNCSHSATLLSENNAITIIKRGNKQKLKQRFLYKFKLMIHISLENKLRGRHND